MRIIKFFATISITVLSAFIGYGQERYGFIDFEEVIQSLPEKTLMEENLDLKSIRFQDSLQILNSHYYHFLNYRVPHNTDSIKLVAFNDSLKTLQSNISAFTEYAKDAVETEQKKILDELLKIVRTELKQFCIENQIHQIADKSSLLYCVDCTDFTKELIEFLKGRK